MFDMSTNLHTSRPALYHAMVTCAVAANAGEFVSSRTSLKMQATTYSKQSQTMLLCTDTDGGILYSNLLTGRVSFNSLLNRPLLSPRLQTGMKKSENKV